MLNEIYNAKVRYVEHKRKEPFSSIELTQADNTIHAIPNIEEVFCDTMRPDTIGPETPSTSPSFTNGRLRAYTQDVDDDEESEEGLHNGIDPELLHLRFVETFRDLE